MAKKTTTTNEPIDQTTTTREQSKADAVRQYKADHPEAGPSEISKALIAAGIDIKPGAVSVVLRGSNRPNKQKTIDASIFPVVKTFLTNCGGKAEDAKQMVEKVGGFVEEFGSKQNAMNAIDFYENARKAFA